MIHTFICENIQHILLHAIADILYKCLFEQSHIKEFIFTFLMQAIIISQISTFQEVQNINKQQITLSF